MRNFYQPSIAGNRIKYLPLIALLIVGLLAAVMQTRSVAAATIITLKPSTLAGAGWGILVETGLGAGEFTAGPETAPLGDGSVRLTTDTGDGGVMIGALAYAGTPLADITRLEYSTYQSLSSTSTDQAIALQFSVDDDLTDDDNTWKGRLVFEPYYSETVEKGTWQTWNPLAEGRWWSTQQATFTQCTMDSPCTWFEVLTHYPDAGIHGDSAVGAILLKAGSGWPAGFDGNADALTIGIDGTDMTYDFEPETTCTAVCYVDAVNGDDSFGGDTPASAKKTIQAGVDQVDAGGTVIVAPGVYVENVTINKSLTLTGAGDGDNPTEDTILDGATLTTGKGIYVETGVTDVTIEKLRIENYKNASGSGIWANGQNHNFTVQNVTVDNNGIPPVTAAGGIYMNGPVDNVLIDGVTAHNNNGRGIVIWNGFKTNITITNNDVQHNNCCGIELQDGTASGVTMTGNTVMNNGDSGISAIGLTAGAGPNLIANNTLVNNGRFGIEIKMPDGTGLDSGDGSILVENNSVTLTTTPADLRDYAAIAAFRRGYLVGAGYVDIPTGVIIRNNTVSGYRQDNAGSNSTGFGIVVEGTNMAVMGNTVEDNDVGVQVQAGHLPYNPEAAGDGDQGNLDDDYFGRGNSPVGCAAVSGNTYNGNTVEFRMVGPVGGGPVTNVDSGNHFCGIQEAIDAAGTLDGHTIQVGVGTYDEDVLITKSLVLRGPNVGNHPQYDARSDEATISGEVALAAGVDDVVIEGFTIQDGQYGVRAASGVNSHSSITIRWNDFTNTEQSAVRHGLGFGAGLDSADWVISDNRIGHITGNNATAIVIFNTIGVTITNNYLRHLDDVPGRRGINLDGVRDVTVSNNDVDLGVTDFSNQTAVFNAARYNVQLSMSDRSTENVMLDDNTFGGAYDGLVTLGNGQLENVTIAGNDFANLVFGIRTQAGASTPGGSHTDITIEGNTITNLIREGIRFHSPLPSSPYANVAIHLNNISGNGQYGLRTDDDVVFGDGNTAFDATCNWWGAASGPSGVGPGTGDRVSNFVDFDPWLLSPAPDGICDTPEEGTSDFFIFLPVIQQAPEPASMASGR